MHKKVSKYGHGGRVVVTQPPSNFRSLHESISRRILQNSVGWTLSGGHERIVVLVELFMVLHDGRMPADEAKKIAKMYQAVPEDLRQIGKKVEADTVETALRSLEGRVDAPKEQGDPWYVGVVALIKQGLPKSSEPPMEVQMVGTIGNLVYLLERNRPMPASVARQIAEELKNVPIVLEHFGHKIMASEIKKSLQNLASRKD